ncbi:hypothetical protein [Methanocella sp. MCL-LM]|uniref:hypothetical protein n=1 Tax=Methanocella sp. MCL-LM TaxID=3412035 RepID=UPI003C738369
MSMHKGWPLISTLTGLVTLLVIWLAYTLFSSIELSRTRMSMRLYELQEPGSFSYSALDSAELFLLVVILTMLLCGIIATLLSRPSGVSLLKGLYPSLLAASIPLVAIDLFQVLSYITATQQYYQGNRGPGPLYPTEPPFLPVYLLLMAIVTLPSLILSAAGGILALWAISSGKNGP